MRSSGFLPIFLVIVACHDKSPEDTAPTVDWQDVERGPCNPVDDMHCLLPFPSSFFLAGDTGTVSGYRVDYAPESMPVNNDGVGLDPTTWNLKDGFSTLGPLFAGFPGVDPSCLVGPADIGAYESESATTVILDAETGLRQPHFAEPETRADSLSEQLLLIRPVAPLEHAQRYVVGIRNLVDSTGATMTAPVGFAALRDGKATSDPDLERQRQHYEDSIFPVLDAAGFQRQDLLMAWDFVTVSKESSLGAALAMRDDAISRIPKEGPAFIIDEQEDEDCTVADPPAIGRTLSGHVTVPLYLNNWDPGSRFNLGSDGLPAVNGEAQVPFTVRIPCSLVNDPHAAPILEYGHGLLGSQSEVYGSYLGEMADAWGWILFAMDWTGMKSDDATWIMGMIGEGMSDFPAIAERTQQGFVEHLVGGRMIRSSLAADPSMIVNGTALVDPTRYWYYGNSQGSILGGAYVAFSPDIPRAVLGVPGTPYALLLTRSADFDPYIVLFGMKYDHWADISLLLGLVQMVWDPGENAGWAHFISQEPVDSTTPNKTVLLQAGIGDSQVPTLGAHVLARALGASLVEPATREVWGLDTRTPPFEGSALVEWDYGVTEPTTCEPAGLDADVHEWVRREPSSEAQLREFLEEGTVSHYCDGICDPG